MMAPRTSLFRLLASRVSWTTTYQIPLTVAVADLIRFHFCQPFACSSMAAAPAAAASTIVLRCIYQLFLSASMCLYVCLFVSSFWGQRAHVIHTPPKQTTYYYYYACLKERKHFFLLESSCNCIFLGKKQGCNRSPYVTQEHYGG